MSIRNSDGTIGNRTRDFPACSAVPQPTAPPRAPFLDMYRYEFMTLVSSAYILEVRHGTIRNDAWTFRACNEKYVSCGREKEAACRTIQQEKKFWRKPHFVTNQILKNNSQTVTRATSTISQLTELHKIANSVLRKVEHKLHQGVLYLQNIICFRGTRVIVIRIVIRKEWPNLADCHKTQNCSIALCADLLCKISPKLHKCLN